MKRVAAWLLLVEHKDPCIKIPVVICSIRQIYGMFIFMTMKDAFVAFFHTTLFLQLLCSKHNRPQTGLEQSWADITLYAFVEMSRNTKYHHITLTTRQNLVIFRSPYKSSTILVGCSTRILCYHCDYIISLYIMFALLNNA